MAADPYLKELIDRFIPSESFNAGGLRLAYRAISLTPGFDEKFRTYSHKLQKETIRLLVRGGSSDTVFTLTRLMHDHGYDPEIFSLWTYLDSSKSPCLYNGPGSRPSLSFVIKTQEFVAVLRERNDAKRHGSDIYRETPVFFFILRTLHSEELVSEMVDYWIRNIEHFTYPRFVQFAEHWEELKSYPVEWSMNFFETPTMNEP